MKTNTPSMAVATTQIIRVIEKGSKIKYQRVSRDESFSCLPCLPSWWGSAL